MIGDSRLAYVSPPPNGDPAPVPVPDAETEAEAAVKVKVIRKPRTKKQQPRTKVKATQVGHTQVKRDVWRTAMRLAGGDAHRLVVRSTVNVTVANSRAHADTLRKTI